MAEFVNTIDVLGDKALTDSIIDKSITEYYDDNVTAIGKYAFFGCTALASINIPAVTRIESNTFQDCSNLVLTSLPEGLKSIGENAFQGSKTEMITFPAGVESIATFVFRGCAKLGKITFEGKPSSLDGGAFRGCTNLKTINVPWAEGEVEKAPWGAESATINYNYTGE